jgi:glycosyltransferase involved in cell wall biosynthesis
VKAVVLFLSTGKRVPEPGYQYYEKFTFLGSKLEGFSIGSTDNRKYLVPISTGKIVHYFFAFSKGNIFKFKIISNAINTFRMLVKAMELLWKFRFINIIIARSPFQTAVIAIILATIFKRKSLLEINGNFDSAFRFERPSGPTQVELFKEMIGRYLIRFSLKRVSAIKLLYPTQIDCYNVSISPDTIIKSFHDYVPISKMVHLQSGDSKYILTLGYPWYLKGVDTLINAFIKLSPLFPDYRLKVHGWCPSGREYFEGLANNHPAIELNQPVEHPEAISLILNCSLFVLASRTEAMGRVLLEAMACRKPIIASRVGGIPSVVKHDFNGLLFSAGDDKELFEKMKELLSDKDRCSSLAANGYDYVQNHLSEDIFLSKYISMLDNLVAN